MSNTLYTATQNCLETVQKKAKELGLEIEIESDYYWYERVKTYQWKDIIEKRTSEPVIINQIEVDELHGEYNLCPAIQEKQIRQILLAFQEVLGENPEHIKFDGFLNTPFENEKEMLDVANTCGLIQKAKSKAEALCQKYLNELNPMFDREPIQVLEELTEIINKL